MIGIILVTHGRLGHEFVAALEHVVGKKPGVMAISIAPDDNMETKRQEIAGACKTVDTGKGVVILTDMFGGTPSNLAISMLQKDSIEVIAGINLPLLIKLASMRSSPMADAVAEAQDAGKKYINVASALLPEN